MSHFPVLGGRASGWMLSIVVPLYNEEAVLPVLHRRLAAVLQSLPERTEIVFVDDGSTDRSAQVLAQLRLRDSCVSVLRFSRNFGKEQAMAAGLKFARGEAVVVMDADLQHPPEMIPAMVQAWRAGADMVNMRRRSRDDESPARRIAARLFYRTLNRLSDIPIPEDVGDFRLLSRRAVDALNQLPEHNRFMKGLFAWVGFNQQTLEFDVAERAGGQSKWRPRQLWRLAVEGITAFSVSPLRLATKAGLLSALAALCSGLYFFIRTLFFGDPVAGFPTLIVVVLMLGGLQLLAIGVLGEYLGRLWIESKQRPLFIVESYEPATAQVMRAAELMAMAH